MSKNKLYNVNKCYTPGSPGADRRNHDHQAVCECEIDIAAERVGTTHEEYVRPNETVWCRVCGVVPSATTDRYWHADSFDVCPENVPTFACKFCGSRVDANLAHILGNEWVGDCCWDERLRS